MRFAPRASVASVPELVHWLDTAKAGDAVIYHLGRLGEARAAPEVRELADLALAAADCRLVVAWMRRVATDVGGYGMTRTTSQARLPSAVATLELMPSRWRVLRLLADPPRDAIKAGSVRLVANSLGVTEAEAEEMLGEIEVRGWIEPRSRRLTKAGAEAVQIRRAQRADAGMMRPTD